jgi:hypothetical protein
MDVDSVTRILSLDRPNGDGRHHDPWEEDPDFERVEERTDLAALVRNLPATVFPPESGALTAVVRVPRRWGGPRKTRPTVLAAVPLVEQ